MSEPVNPLTQSIKNYTAFRDQMTSKAKRDSIIAAVGFAASTALNMHSLEIYSLAHQEARDMRAKGSQMQEVEYQMRKYVPSLFLFAMLGSATLTFSIVYAIGPLRKNRLKAAEGYEAYRQEIKYLLKDSTKDMVEAAEEQTHLQLIDPATGKRSCPLFPATLEEKVAEATAS